MSRRKQKFPVHLKNEQVDEEGGGGGGVKEEVEEEVEEEEEERGSIKVEEGDYDPQPHNLTTRVPINGEVVVILTTSDITPFTTSQGHESADPTTPEEGGITTASLTTRESGDDDSTSIPKIEIDSEDEEYERHCESIREDHEMRIGSCESRRESVEDERDEADVDGSCESETEDSKLSLELYRPGSDTCRQSSEELEPCAIVTPPASVPSAKNPTVITVIQSAKGDDEGIEGEGARKGVLGGGSVTMGSPYVCPVCRDAFKSKRSFNAHIIVHCQLVNGCVGGSKRPMDTPCAGSPDAKRPRDETHTPQVISPPPQSYAEEVNNSLPLDLSCRGSCGRPAASSTPEEDPSAPDYSPPLSLGHTAASWKHHSAGINLSAGTLNHSAMSPTTNSSSGMLNQSSGTANSTLNQTSGILNHSSTSPLNQSAITLNQPSGIVSSFNHANGAFTTTTNLLTTTTTAQLNHSSAHVNHRTLRPAQSLNLSDRGPLEDENDNLVNEAREREKAFLNTAQNEQYLTEDSTGLDPPPPLPLYGAGGAVRRVRVGGGDDGPPMVYTVRLHAEQVLVSRILGINDETGDKMELYKCFMCGVALPSISRLQAHLSHHKQRFVCSKCNFSCDSRVQFSSHIQREHLSPVVHSRRDSLDGVRGEVCEDSSSAENTVTVAALLSALREKARSRVPTTVATTTSTTATEEDEDDDEEDNGISSEDSCPISPSSENQDGGDSLGQDGGGSLGGGSGGEEMFKMYTCRFCGKKFDRAFSCNRHERVHTGYKPCFCRVCGRGFSEPRNLRHHVIRFHSDGSLRHLIKRDRRRKGEDEAHTHTHSPPSPVTPLRYPEARLKDVLKETANKLISRSNIDLTTLSGKTNGLEISLAGKKSNGRTLEGADGGVACPSPSPPPPPTPALPPPTPVQSTTPEENLVVVTSNLAPLSTTVTTYTTSLTKIIAASLDNSTRGGRRHPAFPLDTTNGGGGGGGGAFRGGGELEPGEIRLDRRARIVEDGEGGGRRLVVTEDDEDHSPHFSNYAPRLNIVQEPIDRDKALLPITDDIGRTFFECPYCHKLFGSTSDMNRHLDFHEDLRPYNCEYCDYSARTNSQLKVHKMRHEGIKLYSCDVCNYNGVTQSDLNRHKKTQSHIARSQNVCAMCGLGFYTASQKQVHVVQCHPEVEGASSLIQMSMGPPVAPLIGPPSAPAPDYTAPPTPPPPPPPPHPHAHTAAVQ